MAAVETTVVGSTCPTPTRERNRTLRIVQAMLCVAVPVAVWLSPLPVADNAKAALAITAFMILAWMTETLEYGATGLVGLFLYWVLGVAPPAVVFAGFVDEASWYYIGAMLLGTMVIKSGLPQRLASFVVARVGLTYSSLLLGLLILSFLLTFIIPSGTARLVIMAPICIGVIRLFGMERGSNIGRGIFLLITYSTTIFDKMIIVGAAAITARSAIERVGEVTVTYSFWLLAFLPASVITIILGWKLTLWLWPPEVASLEGRREEVSAHFRSAPPWSFQATKATILVAIALLLWLTDGLHGVSAAVVAFGIGMIGLVPFVDVLDTDDLRSLNLLPFFFIAAALGMGEVLRQTGALVLLTNSLLSGMEPMLSNRLIAVPVLYWTGFVYHFFTASEVTMLATSLPVLMEFAKTHSLDPLWVGMVWTFTAGGKLFAYQCAPLIVGYAYGYFRHTDLIKLGALLTIVEFFSLTLCAGLYWPLLSF